MARVPGIAGGYRQVVLPFLTVTHLWNDEHPDPEEELLKCVLDVLQARWEDFAERDLGLFLEAPPPNPATLPPDAPPPKRECFLWLITCKTRQHIGAPAGMPATPGGDDEAAASARLAAAEAATGMAGAPSAEEMAAHYLAAQQIVEETTREIEAGRKPRPAEIEADTRGDRLSPPPEPLAAGMSSARSGSGSSQAGSEESA